MPAGSNQDQPTRTRVTRSAQIPLLVVGLLCLALSARADEANEAADPWAGVEEMVVTSEGVLSALTKTSVAVTAFDAGELESMGATLVEIDLPNSELGIPCYYVLAPAEASSNLARFDGVRYGYRAEEYDDLESMYVNTRSEGFGAEVQRRILVGTYALSSGYYDAYYIKAQKLRRLIANDFRDAFEQCDVILGPTAPHTAPRLGAISDDPVKMYLEDIFTVTVNLAGLPGLSIPVGLAADGLPVGMQLIGNYMQESRILNVAHQYQQATDWHLRRPQTTGGNP